jgi:hypothetical protein
LCFDAIAREVPEQIADAHAFSDQFGEAFVNAIQAMPEKAPPPTVRSQCFLVN